MYQALYGRLVEVPTMGEISLGQLEGGHAAQGTTFRRILVDVLSSLFIRHFFANNNKGNMGNKKLPNFKHQQHISLPLSSTTLINTNVVIIIIISCSSSSKSSSIRTFMKKVHKLILFPWANVEQLHFTAHYQLTTVATHFSCLTVSIFKMN